MSSPFAEAENHLLHCGREFKKLVTLVGPCTLSISSFRSPYESLVRSIIYQQLHGKAAEAILNRLIAAFPEERFPSPETLLKARVPKLRKCGLSESKVLALKDLARHTISGTVRSTKMTQKLSNEEIIETLTKIRGIGVWTVQMMLIFKLGRLDVLPATDYGVQKGFALTFKKSKLPTPKEITVAGERWKPYRSVASWYLWRAV